MYCTKCGVQLEEKDIFCSQCGHATEKALVSTGGMRHIYRSRYDAKIAGVCRGVADYLDVDPALVRVVCLVLAFLPPSIGIIGYLIAWIVIPREPAQISGQARYVAHARPL